MMEVLHGTPVRVLRLALAILRPTENMPSALASGCTGVVIGIISKVHSWSQLSSGIIWRRQMILPVSGWTAQRVSVPAMLAPTWFLCASDDGPTAVEP